MKPRFFLLTSLCCTLASCTSNDAFNQRLEMAVKQGEGTRIEFSEVTDFVWRRVYVYGPYHPLDEINKKHNTNLKGEYDFRHVSEGDCLYVFETEKKTVRTIFFPRYKVSCLEILKPGVFTPTNAVFEVKIKVNGSHPQLIWLRSNTWLNPDAQRARAG